MRKPNKSSAATTSSHDRLGFREDAPFHVVHPQRRGKPILSRHNPPSRCDTERQGKAAAAAAAASGLPLTIGRPVVKGKEAAKAVAPAAGVRPRVPGTPGGMPIIGRPVVTPVVPPSKVAKVPGMGDSPQASTQQLQQQQQSTPGGQAMVGGRMGAAGPQTPGQTMQVMPGWCSREGVRLGVDVDGNVSGRGDGRMSSRGRLW